jgi:uncharacterized OB-fold protein
MSEQKPLPRITRDNRPFWEACRRHRLELPYCGDCGKPHLPPGPVCPFCFSSGIEWRAASGRGTISSWTIVHKEWFPAFRSHIPYNVVQVALEEGPRLTANVIGTANVLLRVGLRVEAVFDDVAADLTLLRFRPVE